jgi:hypothetical protein
MRFVALYAGESLSNARLIALTGDPDAVRAVAESALLKLERPQRDPAARAVEAGRRKALKSVLKAGAK